jgi:hypothetical protein
VRVQQIKKFGINMRIVFSQLGELEDECLEQRSGICGTLELH